MAFDSLYRVKMKEIHLCLQNAEQLVQKVTDANWWHLRIQGRSIKITKLFFRALGALKSQSFASASCSRKSKGMWEGHQKVLMFYMVQHVDYCPQMKDDRCLEGNKKNA